MKRRISAAISAFDAAYFTPSLSRREAVWADHKAGTLPGAALPKDVLMALVMARDTLSMSREEILKEAIYFILAGAHTSINALTHATHDVFAWLAAHPEQSARAVDDPFFIQACVFESLRLNPSSPVAMRRALCPVDLEHSRAETGDEVIVDLRAANRNAALFGDDATQFNPDRNHPAAQLPYGLSMGHGMHACLGRNLAVGVVPRQGADPQQHQFGTVPLIVEALFRHGVAPDPAEPPQRDDTVTRFVWARYPVLFRTNR